MDQIEHHGDAHPALLRLGLDVLDLLFVAVEQRDVAPFAVEIASLGLVEHLGDAIGVELGQARGDVLVLRPGGLVRTRSSLSTFGVAVQTLEHVARRAHVRFLFPDRRDHRHALVTASRLAFGHRITAYRVSVGLLGRLARRIPQPFRTHRHALAVRRHHLQRLRAERVVGGRRARLVESLEVGRRADDLLLGLPFRHVAGCSPIDSCDAPIERRLDGGVGDLLAQRQRVDLRRQVQLAVHRELRLRLARQRDPVPPHAHAAEFHLQPPFSLSHSAALWHRPRRHLGSLPLQQLVQPSLQQAPLHFGAPLAQLADHLRMRSHSSASQLADHHLQLLTRCIENIDVNCGLCCHRHGRGSGTWGVFATCPYPLPRPFLLLPRRSIEWSSPRYGGTHTAALRYAGSNGAAPTSIALSIGDELRQWGRVQRDPRDERIAELEALVAKLTAQVERLMGRVEELEEQVRTSSRNSSKPPSSDPPTVTREPKSPTGRKPGGQPGHKRHQRQLFPAEKVRSVTECKPERCGDCGHRLRGSAPAPRRSRE